MRFLQAGYGGLVVAMLPVTLAVTACGEPSERPPDFARDEGQPPRTPLQQQETIDVDEEMLEQFAHAYLDVRNVNQELQGELARVGDDLEQAQQLQQEYTGKMHEAMQENDLAVEEYRQIVNTINTDEDLREHFIETLEGVQRDRGPQL